MHWAEQYIGLPWESGQQGPDKFDCWGLVKAVQKQHFGRDLPAFKVDADNLRAVIKTFTAADERNRWVEVAVPQEGDCLLLSQGKQPTHVGIWLNIDGGGLLHCVRGAGVVFSNRTNLQLLGYNILGAYRCSPP